MVKLMEDFTWYILFKPIPKNKYHYHDQDLATERDFIHNLYLFWVLKKIKTTRLIEYNIFGEKQNWLNSGFFSSLVPWKMFFRD